MKKPKSFGGSYGVLNKGERERNPWISNIIVINLSSNGDYHCAVCRHGFVWILEVWWRRFRLDNIEFAKKWNVSKFQWWKVFWNWLILMQQGTSCSGNVGLLDICHAWIGLLCRDRHHVEWIFDQANSEQQQLLGIHHKNYVGLRHL